MFPWSKQNYLVKYWPHYSYRYKKMLAPQKPAVDLMSMKTVRKLYLATLYKK